MIIVTWLLHHRTLLVVVLLIGILYGMVTAVIEGYLDFLEKANAPKKEMFWCTKHGAFPKELTLQLFPELGPDIANTHVCPSCYKQVVFDNPDKRLK